MVRIVLPLLLWSLVAVPAGGQWAQPTGPGADPGEAVFLLANFDREPAKDGLFHAHFSGTGFFIGSDGTALTASHVVYATAHHPDKYRLLAIVGREFYDATIVCSSKLPYDPLNGDRNQVGVQLSRDVAEVKLAPSTAFEGRQDELYFFPKDAPRFPLARAHTDALPVFPYLTISGEPAAYGRVRVIGFGHISPIPQRWASEGRVDRAWSAGDGTPLFDLESANPAQPGDSGSPVLNDQNQVVGIYAWHSYHEPTRGTMEGNAVFQKPCP